MNCDGNVNAKLDFHQNVDFDKNFISRYQHQLLIKNFDAFAPALYYQNKIRSQNEHNSTIM